MREGVYTVLLAGNLGRSTLRPEVDTNRSAYRSKTAAMRTLAGAGEFLFRRLSVSTRGGAGLGFELRSGAKETGREGPVS